jgi:hypothetical protein
MSNVFSGAKLFGADTDMADRDSLNLSYTCRFSLSYPTDIVKRETQVLGSIFAQSH